MRTPDTLLDRIGRALARYLQREPERRHDFGPSDKETLRQVMRPGDVLLVEGRAKLSAAIRYLTQSTWTHSALYIGDALPKPASGDERPRLVEVNPVDGCVTVPLSKYEDSNTRICRPVGLTPQDRDAIVSFMIDRLGTRYDMKNIIDLMRYLLPTPPIPTRFRRRMIALGSGDPTRAICSTLLAQAFESVRYPILPTTRRAADHHPQQSGYTRSELLHIRHHSLYTPRDFDLSPYFAVVKPTLVHGFKYKELRWAEPEPGTASPTDQTAGAHAAE